MLYSYHGILLNNKKQIINAWNNLIKLKGITLNFKKANLKMIHTIGKISFIYIFEMPKSEICKRSVFPGIRDSGGEKETGRRWVRL